MINKTLIEEQINNKMFYGIMIENESCELRFPFISENKQSVEDLLCAIPDDVTTEHIKDIIRDHILGKAYDKLIMNNLE